MLHETFVTFVDRCKTAPGIHVDHKRDGAVYVRVLDRKMLLESWNSFSSFQRLLNKHAFRKIKGSGNMWTCATRLAPDVSVAMDEDEEEEEEEEEAYTYKEIKLLQAVDMAMREAAHIAQKKIVIY